MTARDQWDLRFVPRRIAFLVVVLVWTAVGEDLPSGGWRFWYGYTVMGIPSHYLILAGTIGFLLPFVFVTRRQSLVTALRRTGIWIWVVLAWAAVVIALTRAILDGATNPFVDWRNFAVVGVVAALATRWLMSERWSQWMLTDLAIAYGLVAIPYLIAWALSEGITVLGVRVPTFHGPLLYMSVFASLALTLVWATNIHQAPPFYRFLVRAGAVSSSLLVVLSFRRSWWLAWGLGMVVILYILLRKRWSNARSAIGLASALTVAVIAGFIFLGTETVMARLASFIPSADNEFSATNEDHVNDIRDALAVIAQEPILGYGIGEFYETDLIANWKAVSFDVHSAVLHAWLKYGLLGAIAYVGFHIKWIRAMWHQGRTDDPSSPALTGAAIYVAGNLIGTTVGTWPYLSTQLAIFHGLLIAGLAVAVLNRSQRTAHRLRRPVDLPA